MKKRDSCKFSASYENEKNREKKPRQTTPMTKGQGARGKWGNVLEGYLFPWPRTKKVIYRWRRFRLIIDLFYADFDKLVTCHRILVLLWDVSNAKTCFIQFIRWIISLDFLVISWNVEYFLVYEVLSFSTELLFLIKSVQSKRIKYIKLAFLDHWKNLLKFHIE